MATSKKTAAARGKKTGKGGAAKKKRQGKLAPSAKARGLDAAQVAAVGDNRTG